MKIGCAFAFFQDFLVSGLKEAIANVIPMKMKNEFWNRVEQIYKKLFFLAISWSVNIGKMT